MYIHRRASHRTAAVAVSHLILSLPNSVLVTLKKPNHPREKAGSNLLQTSCREALLSGKTVTASVL